MFAVQNHFCILWIIVGILFSKLYGDYIVTINNKWDELNNEKTVEKKKMFSLNTSRIFQIILLNILGKNFFLNIQSIEKLKKFRNRKTVTSTPAHTQTHVARQFFRAGKKRRSAQLQLLTLPLSLQRNPSTQCRAAVSEGINFDDTTVALRSRAVWCYRLTVNLRQ